MDSVILLSKDNKPVKIDRDLLRRVSVVFDNMSDQTVDPIASWDLQDFSEQSLQHFVHAISRFSDIDVKLPKTIVSEHFASHVADEGVVAFFASKSNTELIELSLLSNYIECRWLFQLCSLFFACMLAIPQHAVMAHVFDFPLTVPSDEILDLIVT